MTSDGGRQVHVNQTEALNIMRYRIEYNFRGSSGYWACEGPEGLTHDDAYHVLIRLHRNDCGLDAMQPIPDSPSERIAILRDLGISDVRILSVG